MSETAEVTFARIRDRWVRRSQLVVRVSDGEPLCRLIFRNVFHSRREAEEATLATMQRGDLMACAPELRDALTGLLDHYVENANSGDWGNWNPEEEPVVRVARAALAKARGEVV